MPRRATVDSFLARVGERIRALREGRELTLEKLAYESQVGSKGYVSDIENGRASASLTTLKKLADRLAVSVAEFVAVKTVGIAAEKRAPHEPTPHRRTTGPKRRR